MTKDSGLYSIPIPNDATPKSGSATLTYLSNVDTVLNLTAFYHSYMSDHGWQYEARYSWTDPSAGIAKGVGYTTDQVFCIAGSPTRTVAVIVGSGDDQDHGKHAEIIVQDYGGKGPCP
jgi:hypothetical protein